MGHTSETSLLVLHDRRHRGDGGSESLTGILHLLGSLGTGSSDVLHGLREARVSESTLLGDAHEELTELVVGLLLSTSESTAHGSEGSTSTSSGLGVGSADGSRGSLALSVHLGLQGGHVRLHRGADIMSLLLEGIGVSRDLGVGLLDLLLSLVLQSEERLAHGSHGITELPLGLLLSGSDLAGKSCASLGALSGSMGLSPADRGELPGHLSGGSSEVLLSLGSSRADSVQELTAHLGASLLGVETQVLDLRVGTLGELGDLSGDLQVQGSLGLLVHVHELGLSLGHANLTLLHGITHGRLKLSLVGLHDGCELGTTLGIPERVAADNASELVHLTLELVVVGDHSLVQLGHASGEVVLCVTEGVLNVETSTASLLGETAVDLHLGTLALLDGSVQLAGLLGEHV